MFSVPLKAFPDLARELAPKLSGKTVLDTGNAYEQRDGEAAREASASEGFCRLGRGNVSGREVGQSVQHGELQNPAG